MNIEKALRKELHTKFEKRQQQVIYFYPGAVANRVASEACVQAVWR